MATPAAGKEAEESVRLSLRPVRGWEDISAGEPRTPPQSPTPCSSGGWELPQRVYGAGRQATGVEPVEKVQFLFTYAPQLGHCIQAPWLRSSQCFPVRTPGPRGTPSPSLASHLCLHILHRAQSFLSPQRAQGAPSDYFAPKMSGWNSGANSLHASPQSSRKRSARNLGSFSWKVLYP